MRRVYRWAFVTAAVFIAVLLQGCPSGSIGNVESATTCLACHNGRVGEDMRHFFLSSHRSIACGTCHIGSEVHVQSGGAGGGLINPANWLLEEQAAVCAQCHARQVTNFLASEHAQVGRLACDVCHDVHTPLETRGPVTNNVLCLSCHLRDWPNSQAVADHTNHPVDPSGTGASRCVGCHMPAQSRPSAEQPDGPHSHTFIPIPPIESAEQAQEGETVKPNSCAGTVGCHDGTVPTAPVFNLDDPVQMTGLQAIFDLWYGDTKDASAQESDTSYP